MYELWLDSTGNIITGGETPDFCLDYIRAVIDQDGVAAVGDYSLVIIDDNPEGEHIVLTGKVLADFASAVPVA